MGSMLAKVNQDPEITDGLLEGPEILLQISFEVSSALQRKFYNILKFRY